jgi:SAM-dependent methyltransferase
MVYDFKTGLIDALLQSYAGRPLRVLDLGSGTSKDFPELLRRYPNVSYTGVEPMDAARNTAAKLLDGIPNVVLEARWGESLASSYRNQFDVTLSLSVLEHVKYLEAFLKTSVSVTKPGGLVWHRYDLGHALYPASWYERGLVVASRTTPWLVPAGIFTTRLDPARVTEMLTAFGVHDITVRHGQMHGLKQAMNAVAAVDPDLARRIVELDVQLVETLTPILPPSKMQWLFPTVLVKGVKA